MTDESNEMPVDADLAAAPENTPSTPTTRSPGAMIRSARERAHISVEELGAQIKLARATLEALERDDFNQLLEPVYVRGYYRKCAKVLGLNENELMEAYQGRALPKVPVAPAKLRLASGTELGTDNRLPLPMAIVAAVFVIFVCVLAWKMVKAPPQTIPTISVPATVSQSPIHADELSNNQPVATDNVDISPDSVPMAEPIPEPTAAAETPAPVTSTAPSVATAADGTATLEFSNSSWVRVDDANGEALLNGLLHAGAKKVLKGKLPFNVFLGNAPAVTVLFEGKSVDFSQRIGENFTARFSLPEKTGGN